MKYQVDNTVIDTTLFRISRDGVDLSAEPRVFDLLVYLMGNRDRVVSRDELFTEVWAGRNVTDATLSNHIKLVRKIFGDDGERQRVIQTVRGRGYQFVADVEERPSGAAAKSPAGADLRESAEEKASTGEGEAESGGILIGSAAPQRHPDVPKRPAWLRPSLAAGLLLAVVIAASFWGRRPDSGPADDESPYILVVPFDVSAVTSDAWKPFADQMVWEVIRNLRKISGLRVVPPPSSFTFEGNKARDHIRDQLPGVRYVLDGMISVGSTDTVRIAVELEDLRDDQLIWDDDYQTRIDDTNFFAVQSEIAESVSDSLQVVVLEDEQRALAELPTRNLEAYEAYVAGQQQTDLLTRESLRRAVIWFDEAIVLDPGFTAAYIAQANANRMLMTYFEPPINMLPEVVDSISTALTLDPDSAEARSSLGLAYIHAWRWEDAWLMLNEAKSRDPSLALTELGFALYYSGLGDVEGVRRSLAEANRLDPLNIELADWGQWALSMVGEISAAESWAAEKVRQHPGLGVVYTGNAVAASLAGDHERAIRLATTGAQLDGESPISLIMLARVLGAAGRTAEVMPLLDRAGSDGEYVCPYESAVALLPLGDIDRVFNLLNDAVDFRSNCLIFLRNDPRLEPIRTDPRFATLLTRVGLDDTALAGYPR